MTGSLGNSDVCYPQISKHGDSQKTNFTIHVQVAPGPVIKC